MRAYSVSSSAPSASSSRQLVADIGSVQNHWQDTLKGVRSDAAARRIAALALEHPVMNSRLVREKIAGSDPTIFTGLDLLVERGGPHRDDIAEAESALGLIRRSRGAGRFRAPEHAPPLRTHTATNDPSNTLLHCSHRVLIRVWKLSDTPSAVNGCGAAAISISATEAARSLTSVRPSTSLPEPYGITYCRSGIDSTTNRTESYRGSEVDCADHAAVEHHPSQRHGRRAA